MTSTPQRTSPNLKELSNHHSFRSYGMSEPQLEIDTVKPFFSSENVETITTILDTATSFDIVEPTDLCLDQELMHITESHNKLTFKNFQDTTDDLSKSKISMPPMSPTTLANYNRRKNTVPKSNHKYLMDKTLKKPKYYYYVTVKCELCDALLPRKEMKFHMNDHNKIYPYECKQCHKSFSSPWKLARHIKVVHVNELLVCDECNSTFKCKINLKRHKKTAHIQKNSVECSECNRKFSCRDSLKRHIRGVHSNERPYSCDICDKRFTNKFNLQTHQRRHTQEKPYKCAVCGCTFGYPGVLKNHLEKIHRCLITSIKNIPTLK